MADRQSPEVDTAARRSNQERKNPRIAQLVERFVAEMNQLAGEDRENSDGSVGRLILCGDEGKQTYVYEMKNGWETTPSEDGPTSKKPGRCCTGNPESPSGMSSCRLSLTSRASYEVNNWGQQARRVANGKGSKSANITFPRNLATKGYRWES